LRISIFIKYILRWKFRLCRWCVCEPESKSRGPPHSTAGGEAVRFTLELFIPASNLRRIYAFHFVANQLKNTASPSANYFLRGDCES